LTCCTHHGWGCYIYIMNTKAVVVQGTASTIFHKNHSKLSCKSCIVAAVVAEKHPSFIVSTTCTQQGLKMRFFWKITEIRRCFNHLYTAGFKMRFFQKIAEIRRNRSGPNSEITEFWNSYPKKLKNKKIWKNYVKN
jgi:hypothetical protein